MPAAAVCHLRTRDVRRRDGKAAAELLDQHAAADDRAGRHTQKRAADSRLVIGGFDDWNRPAHDALVVGR